MDFSFLFKTQRKVVKIIDNAIKKNRLSQVYLFEGAKGTPKMQASMYLANLLLCKTSNNCGECLDCNRLDEGVHPRLFIIDATKSNIQVQTQTIKKEQIDELNKEFNYSSFESGNRVFIINKAEDLTIQAANSLLKFLEEMKEDSYGILISDNVSSVIPTIKSRCQVITFDKIDKKTLEEIYLSKGLDEELSKILSTLTNDINIGMEYLKNDNLKNIITLVKKINQSFFNDTKAIMIMNEEGKFLYSLSKEENMLFLDLLITITFDRLYYMLGKKDEMVFLKTIEEMDNIGFDIRQINYQQTNKLVNIMLEYKERLTYNCNLELLYMDLFIKCEV